MPVIGDGGLQYSGQGSRRHRHARLAARGCEESPGDLVFINGKQFKAYRGMGSLGAMQTRGKAKSFSKDRYFQGDVSDDQVVPEGIEGRCPTRAARRRCLPARRRLRQSMFYVGARTIPQLQERGNRADHLRRAQGEPPARHPDDGRGAQLLGPLSGPPQGPYALHQTRSRRCAHCGSGGYAFCPMESRLRCPNVSTRPSGQPVGRTLGRGFATAGS